MSLRVNVIAEYLTKNERSNAWLARQLDVSDETVAKMLKGHMPRVDTVMRLSELINVPITELIDTNDPRRISNA